MTVSAHNEPPSGRSDVVELDLELVGTGLIDRAIDLGASAAEAFGEQSHELTVRVYEGAVESLLEAGSRGLGLRVFADDGRCGFACGSDLSEAGLTDLAESAVAAMRAGDPDENAGLPDNCGAAEVGVLAAPRFGEVPASEKIAIAVAADQAARARDTRVSNVEQTVYSDGSSRVALVNSAGFSGAYDSTGCIAYVSAFAGTGEHLMTGLGAAVGRAPADLDPEAIGHEAADRALALLGAQQIKSRSCAVVLDPFVAASFVGVIAGMLSAEAVQRGRSPFAGRLGDVVAGEAFTLVDDGLDPNGHATAPFDGEGVPQQSTDLIKGEKLQAFLYDTRSARRDKVASTGNGGRSSYRATPSLRPTNLAVAAGDKSIGELFAIADDGFYVTDVAGLHSGVNPASGTFSVGASGIEISGGTLGQPVREVTISGDLVAMLSTITEVGSEVRRVPFGGTALVPPLLIGAMTVAGS